MTYNSAYRLLRRVRWESIRIAGRPFRQNRGELTDVSVDVAAAR
jgi:hypothetical protein